MTSIISQSPRADERERRVALVASDNAGDQFARERRQQHAVAVMSRRVDEPGTRADRPIIGSASGDPGRRPTRAPTKAACHARGTRSQIPSSRSRTPATVARLSNPTSSSVAPTSSVPSGHGTA